MACTTVGDVIETLRCEIKDPDAEIWSDKLLVDFIKQAYTHIASLRPELFSKPQEITLARGKCLQEVCADCVELLEVISVDGQDCNPPDQESTQDNLNDLTSAFDGFNCPTEGEAEEVYSPSSWSKVDCGGCQSFRLSEPTPTDRDVTAIVCCAFDLDLCEDSVMDTELPDIIFNKMYEGFKHLILSKLYATDRKAEDLMALSELHFKYWQDYRDWMFRTDFARSQPDWHLYRQKTTGRED